MPIVATNLTPLLEVFDMPRSVAFYRDVIGFEVVSSWAPDGNLVWAMLKLGGATLMLNERYEHDKRPAQADARRAPGHADTELYVRCADVDAAYEHLRAAGQQVDAPTVTHYGMKQLWISDPDGFRVCFQQQV